MTNTATYNTNTFNAWTPFASDSITDAIIFNWYGLQNNNIISSYKTDYNEASIDLNVWINPIIDGGIVLNKKYSDNVITIEGIMLADTPAELLTLMDEFKLKLSQTEWYLDIKQDDGEYRRIKATLISNSIFDKKHYDITRCPFKLQFKSVEPFFYNRTAVADTLNNIATNVNIDLGYTGTAKTYPQLYFWFNVATAVTEMTIKLGNFSLEINETINVWDILVIDCEEKTVKLNGALIEYDWVFFPLEYGANVVDIQINGTFDYDFTYVYNKKWM